MHPISVGVLFAGLGVALRAVSRVEPVMTSSLRKLLLFVLFWMVMKGVLDALAGVGFSQLLLNSADLGLRLATLLFLGMVLALSTSARSLGLAVSWAVKPFVGRERAWKVALSLSLMVHFLPMCLSTMSAMREAYDRRCAGSGFFRRMVIVPQAVLRNLGQKTWNQTLALAGRGLDSPDAWRPDFAWSGCDSSFALGGAATLIILTLI